MDYPAEILPAPFCKWIDCDLTSCFLIRYTETDDMQELINSSTGHINLKHIYSPDERISDLSCSLLGVYNAKHINLRFTKPLGISNFMHYCEPDEAVEPPMFETEFTNEPGRHFWCLSVASVHNVPFSYTRGANGFTATCIVTHTPMRWNFWHFSLRWQTDLGPLEELEEKLRLKVARRISHSAKALLSQFAKTVLPEHQLLPRECYCKN